MVEDIANLKKEFIFYVFLWTLCEFNFAVHHIAKLSLVGNLLPDWCISKPILSSCIFF